MSQQLFLGKVSLQQDAKQVNFITFQGTTTVGSDRVTAISTGTSKFRVGQTITTVGGAFASNPTILQIISSTEVEVDQNATTTRSGILGLNAGADNYYLSGSFTDPTNQETVLSITGSDDSDFEGNEWACIIPSMDENGTGLPGVFHVYNITSVVDRDNNTAAIDFFIKYGESGSEADFDQYVDTGQRVYGLVQRSTLEDLSPSLSKGISGLNDLPGGIEVAGLNILITDYLDNFTLTDVYYTGSEVLINTQQMNFSGSGVEVTLSGSEGVLVDIKNDTLTSFYTGSEVLTDPTNKINFTGSGVEVESSGSDGILVTIDGGGSGGTYTNSDPTPINFPSDDDPNIPSGTTFSNKTFPEMMDLMLYPELDPTLTNPSNTFSISPSGLREIGETIATITLSATFSKGSINPQYTSATPFRSGDPNTYVYTGTGTSNNASTSLTDTELVTSYTVLQGSNSWTGAVSYDAGPQPKTSKDNDYDSPLSAGTTSAITRTITGVYPAFATTSAIGTLTKQSLQVMTTYIQVSMVAETGNGDKQTIDIPDAWSTITGLQQFNTLSGTWDSISLSSFTTSATTQTIQGNSVNYTKYAYNGSTIGARQLRFTV